ncbi:hypothetical protein D3C77_508280 [compost metagenome]
MGGLLQPLQQGDNPLRQAGQTDHGEGAGHQIEVAPVKAVMSAMLLQPERQVQIVHAGLLLPQASHLLLKRTCQRGERGRGRAIDGEWRVAAGTDQQMILRAALQILQQGLAERIDESGYGQLLLILRQTTPCLQGLDWHQIFPQPDDDVSLGRGIGSLVHQRLQPLTMGSHLHLAIFCKRSPGKVARHQERTATEMKHGHDLPHCTTGTIPATDKWDDRV